MSVAIYNGFQPLNPTLYALLKERFRSVLVANEGSGMQATTFPDYLRPGRVNTEILFSGEYYRVCCPYCGDSRHRLWINHRFGHPDSAGFAQLWLAHCYNEDCLGTFERRKDLEKRIFEFRNRAEREKPFEIQAGRIESDMLSPVRMPGQVIRVDRLPQNHPAAVYLRDTRQHNLEHLGKYFGVSFCHEADSDYRMANGRIIIPIFQNGALVGWQARHTGETDWKVANTPKYYGRPGMAKRLMLYNIDSAQHWPFVVVVEGATSVWRIGGPSVALLGKAISPRQQYLLHEYWTDKTVFLMLDPDAREEMEGIVSEITRLGRIKLVPIMLPEGTDPDNYDHSVNVDIIRQHGARVGANIEAW